MFITPLVVESRTGARVGAGAQQRDESVGFAYAITLQDGPTNARPASGA